MSSAPRGALNPSLKTRAGASPRFFQPFSPDPDNRNLPVLCAVKLEPLLNRKNRHCCSILHLTYQSEITQDMELCAPSRATINDLAAAPRAPLTRPG